MKSHLKHATISLRVPSAFWDTDSGFAVFCDCFSKSHFVDEYAFFSTPLIGTPFPVDHLRRHWEKLGERIEKTRAFAPRVGINHLVTIGHNPHNQGYHLESPARMVSQKGRTLDWKFCPGNPQWREAYIRPTYTMLAQCRPDFIWIDDDLRISNFGDGEIGCFCPVCLEKIRARLGFEGGLPELKKFLGTGSPEELRRRRTAMLEHNRVFMADIAGYIERVVHAVDSKIILGQMDALTYWESNPAGQASALAGPEKIEVWWRPGGGFYTDRTPEDIVAKANCLAAEIAELPPEVTAIQSEIENFYFPVFGKSRHFTSLENQLYCAASGCTGTAYSILGKGAGPVETDPLSVWEPLMCELKRNETFVDRIVANNRRLPLRGVWNGIGRDYYLGNDASGGEWLTTLNMGSPRFHPWNAGDLHALGLPPAFRQADACAAAFGEREVAALSDEALFELLHGGVYLDVPALEALNRRGFGEWTGFVKAGEFAADAVEAQTPHFLNDEGTLYRRNTIQAFWGGIAYALTPAAGAQTIGRLVDLMDRELAACSSGVFENGLGGRVAVIGYAPWHGLGYLHKVRQVRKLFDWLSRDRLPGRVDSLHRAHLWLRPRPDGGINAAVLNSSMDRAEELVLRLATARREATLFRLEQEPLRLTGVPDADGCCRFRLPELAPWSLGYLVAGTEPD